MKLRFFLALLLLCPAAAGRAGGDDWRQFRGPNGTGVSASTNLPVEFGAGKNLRWKTPLPPGHSSPVLSRDRIFVTAFDGTKLLVICVSQKDGKVLWQREVPRGRTDRLLKPNHPASPSPVTDGENVFAFFQDYGLLSYSAGGKERWKLPLGPFNVLWGFGASPILAGKLVILPVDQDANSYMIAVDKDSGRVRWRIERPEVFSGYSTPILYQPAGGPEQILVPESYQLSAYSVSDGRKVWWVRGLACEMKSIASHDADTLYVNGWGFPQNQPGRQIQVPPFADGLARFDADKDGKISRAEGEKDPMLKEAFFVFDLDRDDLLDASDWEAYRKMMVAENGLLAIRLGGSGDMTAKSLRWSYRRPVPQVPSTLLYQGVLFMVNDSGILLSFDPASGNVHKQGRLAGAMDKYFASPVGADGKVFLISQDGSVSVVTATAQWEVLAVNKLEEEVYATPAISGGRIYVRTQNALYSFGK
jgi:outer membrane protein assembly factor BamB